MQSTWPLSLAFSLAPTYAVRSDCRWRQAAALVPRHPRLHTPSRRQCSASSPVAVAAPFSAVSEPATDPAELPDDDDDDDDNDNDDGDGTAPSPPPSPYFVQKSFGSLGLSPALVAALTATSVTQPTGIQSRGIPPILGGADVILGAATGSGKTFCYLLPTIQMLKQAEHMRDPSRPPLRVARRPRALVIVPTRELAEQVVTVAKHLAHAVKFRVVGAVGGGAGLMRKLRDRLEAGPVDVLVATTGRLVQLLDDRAVDVRFVSHVIVDEVDTMFDEGFGPELRRVLRAVRGGKSEVENRPQFIAAGATHPRAAEEVYDEVFPNAKRIDVDLHRAPRGLVQRFVTVTAESKLQELLAFLGEGGRTEMMGGRMMVFCNTMDSCRFLDHFLVESGYRTSCVHGEVPPARRDAEFARFVRGETQLLVCTDMAARGLDNLSVEHVVLFDFPGSAVDYLHRAGRTARAGASGRVTSFVMKKDLRLARAIERAGSAADALESARVAREEEGRRKKAEAEAARENQRRMAMAGVPGEEPEARFAMSGGRTERGGARSELRAGRGSGQRGARGGRRGGSRGESGGFERKSGGYERGGQRGRGGGRGGRGGGRGGRGGGRGGRGGRGGGGSGTRGGGGWRGARGSGRGRR